MRLPSGVVALLLLLGAGWRPSLTGQLGGAMSTNSFNMLDLWAHAHIRLLVNFKPVVLRV